MVFDFCTFVVVLWCLTLDLAATDDAPRTPTESARPSAMADGKQPPALRRRSKYRREIHCTSLPSRNGLVAYSFTCAGEAGSDEEPLGLRAVDARAGPPQD